MLSLRSFLREGRVVGPCWEKLKPKGPKGLYCNPKGRRALLRFPSTVGRSVCLCWEHSKSKGPKVIQVIILGNSLGLHMDCICVYTAHILMGVFPTREDARIVPSCLSSGCVDGQLSTIVTCSVHGKSFSVRHSSVCTTYLLKLTS